MGTVCPPSLSLVDRSENVENLNYGVGELEGSRCALTMMLECSALETDFADARYGCVKKKKINCCGSKDQILRVCPLSSPNRKSQIRGGGQNKDVGDPGGMFFKKKSTVRRFLSNGRYLPEHEQPSEQAPF